MKIVLAAALAGALAALPMIACADTSPVVNRIIVDHELQQQIQNQLNIQQSRLQTQQDAVRANLQNQMLQQTWQMQYLLLQQQLELLKLQQQSRARKPARKHTPHPGV